MGTFPGQVQRDSCSLWSELQGWHGVSWVCMVLRTEVLEDCCFLELRQVHILQLIAMNAADNENGVNASAVGPCRSPHSQLASSPDMAPQ